jgi:hypothetical protein
MQILGLSRLARFTAWRRIWFFKPRLGFLLSLASVLQPVHGANVFLRQPANGPVYGEETPIGVGQLKGWQQG